MNHLPQARASGPSEQIPQLRGELDFLKIQYLSSDEILDEARDLYIGQRLALSPHTVRHHAEWVFTKLGVHSRKALGLRLLGRDST